MYYRGCDSDGWCDIFNLTVRHIGLRWGGNSELQLVFRMDFWDNIGYNN